ncbi:MAG: InlB B-repeat-containing protein, partial [Sphaerochaeta sp.]
IGDAVTQIAQGSTGDRTLYAKWTANTYTVTLNRQPSSDGTASVTAIYNAAMPTASVPSRTGYTFGGYFTETSGGGVQYYTASMASARNWDIAEDTTLYAKWTANSYTVTLDRQPSSNGTASVTATYDGPMPEASAPTRTGYTFGGYFTETSGGGVQYYTASMASDRNWDIAGNTTLYAKWIPNTYTVTLDRTLASDGTASVTATYDGPMPTASAPTRTGYAFGGYYTATLGAGTQYYSDSMASTKDWDIAGDTTLYAKWTLIDYLISYELYGGVNHADNPATYTIVSETITLENPTRTGYTFGGWFVADDYSGTSVSQIVQGSHEDIILHAKWTPIVYTITYTLNGGTAPSPDNRGTYTIETDSWNLASPTRDYYTFNGWYANAGFTGNSVEQIAKGSHGDLALYAKWVPIEYTITYSLKGEANDPDNPTTYTVETETFELGEASLSGHYFAGWYTSHDHTFNTLVWKIETGSHGDIVLYPKTLWEYEIGDMTPAPDYEFVIIDRNDQENNLTPYDYREADTWRYIVAKNYDSSYISDLLIPWTPAGEVDHFFNPSIGGDQGPYGDIGQGKDAPQSVIDYYGTGPDLEYACYAAGSSPGYFLPSLSEMVKLMELMRDRSIGGISIGIPYWTATDVTNEHLAYSVVLQQPDPTKEEFTIEMPIIEKTNEYRVRPMRRI